jgi:ABC-type nickel/cobalt efflux system permease component RcnA
MEVEAASAVLFTAAVLGVTHGIEPDHAAGIASLTSETGDSKRSALVGGCFAAGHVALVLVWIGVAYLLFDATSVPAVTERIGTIVLGIVLVLLSGLLGVTGARTFVHTHGHSHTADDRSDRNRHRHFHLHSPFSSESDGTAGHGSHARDDSDHGRGHDHNHDGPDHDGPDHADHDRSGTAAHAHDHTVRSYLKVGLVGALFTLSPPLSMLALVSVIIGNVGTEGVLLAVSIYAVAIVATMASVGGGVGFVFGAARKRSERVHASLQMASAAIVLALGAYLLWQALPSIAVL